MIDPEMLRPILSLVVAAVLIYGFLCLIVPFVLFAIMRNTRETADQARKIAAELAELRKEMSQQTP